MSEKVARVTKKPKRIHPKVASILFDPNTGDFEVKPHEKVAGMVSNALFYL